MVEDVDLQLRLEARVDNWKKLAPPCFSLSNDSLCSTYRKKKKGRRCLVFPPMVCAVALVERVYDLRAVSVAAQCDVAVACRGGTRR